MATRYTTGNRLEGAILVVQDHLVHSKVFSSYLFPAQKINSSKSEHYYRARKSHPLDNKMTCINRYLKGRLNMVVLHKAIFISNYQY